MTIGYPEKYLEEQEELDSNYIEDPEGLDPMEYFDKYASEDYKKWTAEEIARIDELEKRGILV